MKFFDFEVIETNAATGIKTVYSLSRYGSGKLEGNENDFLSISDDGDGYGNSHGENGDICGGGRGITYYDRGNAMSGMNYPSFVLVDIDELILSMMQWELSNG